LNDQGGIREWMRMWMRVVENENQKNLNAK